MTDQATVETRDYVLRFTFNRPDKKNALTGAMYGAFADALDAAAADPAVRVVLVAGAGDAFTSGNDLKDFATWGAEADVEALPVVRAIRRVLAFPKPLVAAVRGVAVGFGTTLLPHCDAVLASETSRFSMPFVKLGLVPEFGSSYLIPAIAGRVSASHKLLTGDSFGLDEAVRMGLVSEACGDTELEARAETLCRQLAALPPSTVRSVKALMRPAWDRERLEAAIADELTRFVAGLRSPEHREAVSAFLEKRVPDFSNFA